MATEQLWGRLSCRERVHFRFRKGNSSRDAILGNSILCGTGWRFPSGGILPVCAFFPPDFASNQPQASASGHHSAEQTPTSVVIGPGDSRFSGRLLFAQVQAGLLTFGAVWVALAATIQQTWQFLGVSAFVFASWMPAFSTGFATEKERVLDCSYFLARQVHRGGNTSFTIT